VITRTAKGDSYAPAKRFLRHGRWLGLRDEHWQRLEDIFRRHGGKTVFFARSWVA
jgi:membrane protein DedA with SNARE-associated domain